MINFTKLENLSTSNKLTSEITRWDHSEKYPLCGKIAAKVVGPVALFLSCVVDAIAHAALALLKAPVALVLAPYHLIALSFMPDKKLPQDLQLFSVGKHLFRALESVFFAATLPILSLGNPAKAHALANWRNIVEQVQQKNENREKELREYHQLYEDSIAKVQDQLGEIEELRKIISSNDEKNQKRTENNNREMEEKNNELSMLKNTLNKLNLQILNLQGKLDSSYSQINEKKAQLDLIKNGEEKEYKRLHNEINELQKNVEVLQNAFAQVIHEKHKITEKNQALGEEINNLGGENFVLRQDNQNLMATVAKLQNDAKQFQQQVAGLENAVFHNKVEILNRENHIESKEREIAFRNQELLKHDETIKELILKIKTLENQKNVQLHNLESVSKEGNEKSQLLQKKIAQVEQEAREEIATLKNTLNSTLSEKQNISNENSKLIQQLDLLKKEKDSIHEQNKFLNTQIELNNAKLKEVNDLNQVINEKYILLKAENNTQETHLADKDLQNQKLVEEISSLQQKAKSEILTKEHELSKLNSFIEKLQQEIRTLKEKLESNHQEIGQKNSEILSLKNGTQEGDKKQTQLEKKVIELQHAANIYNQQINQFTNELSTANIEKQKITEENIQLRQQLDALQQEQASINLIIQEKTQKIASLNSEAISAKENLLKTDFEKQKLTIKVNELTLNNGLLRNDNNKMILQNQDLLNEKSRLESQSNGLQKEIDRLKEELSKSKLETQSTASQIEKRTQELSEVNNYIENLNQKIHSLEEKLENNRLEILHLNNASLEDKEKHNQLQMKMQELQNAAINYNQQITVLTNALSTANIEKQKITEENIQLRQQLDTKQKEHASINLSIQEKTQKNASLKLKLKTANENLENATLQNRILNERASNLESDNNLLRNDIETNNLKNNDLVNEKSQLENQINKLQNEINRLKKEVIESKKSESVNGEVIGNLKREIDQLHLSAHTNIETIQKQQQKIDDLLQEKNKLEVQHIPSMKDPINIKNGIEEAPRKIDEKLTNFLVALNKIRELSNPVVDPVTKLKRYTTFVNPQRFQAQLNLLEDSFLDISAEQQKEYYKEFATVISKVMVSENYTNDVKRLAERMLSRVQKLPSVHEAAEKAPLTRAHAIKRPKKIEVDIDDTPTLQKHMEEMNKKLANLELSDVQREIVKVSEKNGFAKKPNHILTIFTNLKNIGVKEEDCEGALTAIIKFMQSSNPTVNFKATDMDKYRRIKKKEGLEKIWDAPQGFIAGDLLEKREKVELNMFHFADTPRDNKDLSKDRPIYMAINLGNSYLGAAPYYGGSYFVAKKEIYNKATISAGDSFNNAFAELNYVTGTINQLEAVIAGLEGDTLQQVYDMAMGKIAPKTLPNNQYIEVQAFNVKLSDMEKLVLSRKEIPVGSKAERKWQKLAERNKLGIEFFDVEEWEKKALETGKIEEANKFVKPELKNEERKGITSPTEKNVAYFLSSMNLVKQPVKDVSFAIKGFKDQADKLSLYTDLAQFNDNKEPILKSEGPINGFICSLKPYYQNYNRFKKITEDCKKSIDEYIHELPSEINETLKTKIANLEKKQTESELNKKDQKELKKLKSTYEQAKKRIEINNRIKNIGISMDTLILHPINHLRQYSLLLGEFRNNLDKADIKEMKGNAWEFYKVAKENTRRLELLADILNDPIFREKIKIAQGPYLIKKNENEFIKFIETMGAAARKAAIFAVGAEDFFAQFAESVEVDPDGWINRLPKKPKE